MATGITYEFAVDRATTVRFEGIRQICRTHITTSTTPSTFATDRHRRGLAAAGGRSAAIGRRGRWWCRRTLRRGRPGGVVPVVRRGQGRRWLLRRRRGVVLLRRRRRRRWACVRGRSRRGQVHGQHSRADQSTDPQQTSHGANDAPGAVAPRGGAPNDFLVFWAHTLYLATTG